MTTEKKQRLIDPKTWKEEQPLRLSIHSKYWPEIKMGWKKACRMLNSEGRHQCDTQLDSVDSLIQDLQGMLSKFKLDSSTRK